MCHICKPILITRADIAPFGSDMARRILHEGLKSACRLPLIFHGRALGTLVVASFGRRLKRSVNIWVSIPRTSETVYCVGENNLAKADDSWARKTMVG